MASPPPAADERVERSGVIAAAVLLVVAFPLLIWFGEGQWFGQDEWSFIANRRLPTVDGFFGDHNGHWVTLPLIAYRVNFELFGLHTYVPYQVLVILSHLAIAATVHTLARRAGVRAWTATALLVGFVFYGAGWGNILFAFQIALNGSVLAGLIQFVCADHDGPWSRRDTVGVSIAVFGLMTSAVMPAMSVGVGAMVLLRRGWKIAAGHTVPPAVVFLIWFVAFGSSEESDPHPWRIAQFIFHMFRAAFEGLAQHTIGGAALAAVAALGLTSRLVGARRGDLRAAAIPVGLLTAGVAFGGLTGFNRSGSGVDIAATAAQGRYLHIIAALMLPLIGLGAQQLWEWRRPLVVVPIVLVAIGLPDGIDQMRNRNPFTTGNRDQVVALAHDELLSQVPPSYEPLPFQELRAGWLLDAVDAGDLPDPPTDMPIRAALNIDAAIALRSQPAPADTCSPVEGRISTTVNAGERIVAAGPAQVLVADGEERSSPVAIADGGSVLIQAGPIDVVVRGIDGAAPIVCLDAG